VERSLPGSPVVTAFAQPPSAHFYPGNTPY
jgi:hypothetical protein